MKKISLYFIAFFSMTGSLFAHSNIPASRWKTHEIKVDGNDSDWDKPINLYDGSTGMFFAISNDSSTLYLNFTVKDNQKMMKLINAGWSLNFSTKNKKGKTKASIFFPATNGGAMMVRKENQMNFMSSGSPNKKMDTNMAEPDTFNVMDAWAPDLMSIDNYARNLRTFKASGFIFTDGDFQLQGKSGIVIRVGKSDPVGLLYEIAIPLSELYEEDSVVLNELITMTVSVNAQTQQEGDRSGKPQGDMPEGMGGGGKPGGMPGGGVMPVGGMPRGGMKGESDGNAGTASTKVPFKQSFRLSSH